MPNDDTPYIPRPIEQIAGNIGRHPERKQTSAGDVVEFSMAVTREYGVLQEDKTFTDSKTQWYNAAVWNAQLQGPVLRGYQKGNRVVLEGSSSERVVEGVTYYDFRVNRIGHVEWTLKEDGTPRPADDLDAI